MDRLKVAVIDDTQGLARDIADWSKLDAVADVEFFGRPIADEDEAARTLAPFDVVIPVRERTAFPASLIERLPRLKLLAMTGKRAPTFDIAACTARGILVSSTGIDSAAATSELALTLMLAGARQLAAADAGMRAGRWHEDLPTGYALSGRRLGIVGLGKLGARVAGFGKALGMDVVAWSQNLTAEAAEAEGVVRIEKDELFRTSDVVSLHLVLSDRSRGIVGGRELAAMKPGAMLVNTARAGLVDTPALIDALRDGRIQAGLDVYDEEPLPVDHPLRSMRNVVLTPHLGYATTAVIRQFYEESIENIAAFAAGAPIRLVNPDVLKTAAGA